MGYTINKNYVVGSAYVYRNGPMGYAIIKTGYEQMG